MSGLMCEMRTIGPVLAAVVASVGTAAPAAAQGEGYQVTFTQVINSCDDDGIELEKARVELTRRGKVLTVKIPKIPVMTGTSGTRGKFKARAKRGRTGIAGLDGKFSIAGTTKGRSIEFVFIAEFYKGKSPLCTQSWKGKGSRSTGAQRRSRPWSWLGVDIARPLNRFVARL